MPTRTSLFIIESVSFEEEKDGLFEGQILSQILNLCGVRSDYFFIRTERELIEVIDIFKKTTHRYLHISCHGNSDAVALALDSIDFNKFGEIISDSLNNRRLFLSACQAVNLKLAKILLANGCKSLIGPKGNIRFSDAAIMWASFYHLLFRLLEKEKKHGINRLDLEHLLGEVVDTFESPMRYYFPNKDRTLFYRKEFKALEPVISKSFPFK